MLPELMAALPRPKAKLLDVQWLLPMVCPKRQPKQRLQPPRLGAHRLLLRHGWQGWQPEQLSKLQVAPPRRLELLLPLQPRPRAGRLKAMPLWSQAKWPVQLLLFGRRIWTKLRTKRHRHQRLRGVPHQSRKRPLSKPEKTRLQQ